MVEVQPVNLSDPSSSLMATYVPAAGMICTSLSDGGVEYLGQRRGLQAYLSDGKTMGIPILYPWANRLSGNHYRVGGTAVNVTPGENGVRADAHGAPMHGVLAANPDWRVTEKSENTLTAELDWGAAPARLATFPFPHRLTMAVTLADRTLTVSTTVTPTAEQSVPLCYGYHPYVTIPEVPREDWQLQTPTMRHLLVDDRGCPPVNPGTGRTGRGGWVPPSSTTDSMASSRVRCSPCLAAATGSTSPSTRATPPHSFSRPEAMRWWGSSR